MTPSDLETLALECRSDAYRNSLANSDVWLRVEIALDAAVEALKQNFVVVRNGAAAEPLASAVGSAAAVVAAASDDCSANDDNDDDDDGLGYTIRVNRSQVANGLETGDFAPTAVEVRASTDVAAPIATATSAFRFLRNACVSCRANQLACSKSNAIALAHAVVMGSCQWVDVDDAIKSSVVLLAQVALQFLVNVVTGNAHTQATVWSLFFPDHFQKVLVECQEHRKVVAFAVALVLNCVNNEADGASDVAARRVDLVCARNLMITILQRCLLKPAATRAGADVSLPRTADDAAMDSDDPAFEWICVLFRVLFDAHLAKDLYNAVGAHMLSKLWSRVTPEQLILLRMLVLWITSRTGTGSTSSSAAPTDAHQRPLSQSTARAPVTGAAASLELLTFLQTTWVYVITASDDDRPDEAEPERKRVWIELENDAKLLLLDAIGEVTQVAALLSSDVAHALLVSLLDELQRVWQQRRLGLPQAKATNAATVSSLSELSLQDSGAVREPFGYRSGMIRAIGNLSFRQPRHQDAVRERGHLELFLNHCNIDDANPLVREWSLVALRNLCEGNEANQQYIHALKPQSMDAAAAAAPTQSAEQQQ